MSVKRKIKIGNNHILPIDEFQLSMMCINPAILIIAKRASGKSVICRAILKHFRDIPVGIVIAPTEKMATPPFYSEFVPDSYIHYAYDSTLIESLLIRQSDMINKKQEKKKEGKNIDPRAFILMDDCLSSKGTWMKDQPILELLFNGRHFQLMYILTMQFALGISPELRGNFDYIFLLNEDFLTNRKRLFEHYAGMLGSFAVFQTVFTELTKDYSAMVIVNRGAKAKLTEKIYWYKANNDTCELIGCKQFVDFHKLNFNEEWKKQKKPFDIIDIEKPKKNCKKFIVDKVGKDE